MRRKREAEIKQLLQKREERLESQSVQKKIDANPPKKKYGKWKERQCSHKGKARYQQRKADRSKGGKPFGAAPTRLSGTLAPLMIEERGKTDTPFDLLLGLNEVLRLLTLTTLKYLKKTKIFLFEIIINILVSFS